MKRMKRFLAAVLACLMCIGSMSLTALADETPADSGRGLFAIDKTATPLDEKDYTNVTLAVPGDVEGAVDVVFVLGGNMQSYRETVGAAINVFKSVIESGKVTVRMGLIALERGEEIILDLNSPEAVLNPDTYEQLIEDKFAYISSLPGGTTNLHSQLLEAQKMLEKETEADPENKYVFVMATGRTYWFDDANGEQATIVNKVNLKGKDYYYYADYLWRSQRGGNSSLYMIPDRYNDSYAAFFADVEKWVEADGDDYVFTPHLDVNDSSAYVNWYNKNNKDLKALGVASSRFGLAILDPAPTAENFVTGVMAGIGSGSNPQNALNYERAQYECVQVYQDLVDAGYNCYTICSETPLYQNGSEYIEGIGYKGTSTAQVGHSFMNYLAILGGQEEAPTVWDFERDAEGNFVSSNQVLQKDFFEPIKEDILYTCSIGSTVEDYIGYDAEEGNFEFVQDPTAIALTVGGKTYTTTQIETKEGAAASYEFTAPVEGAVATFWLDYYYGDGKFTEKFIWTFGENVSLANRASLTYKLKLTEKCEENGTYTVDTNIEATLYPKDSNGDDGEPQKFPVPNVEYTVSIDRILNFFKSTVINEVAYALEGITFDVYYVATVDEYTEFVENYVTTNATEIANKKAERQAALEAELKKENPEYVLTEEDDKVIASKVDAEIAQKAQDAFEVAKAAEVGEANHVATVTTGADGKAQCDVSADGIYLVIEREHPAIVAPLDPFAVAVPMTSEDGSELVRVVNINPKNDVLPGPEVEKNVTSIGTDLDSFDIGQTHTWILRGGMPVDATIGKSYVLTDVMSESLTYVGNVKVAVGDADAQAGTEAVTLVAGEDYTVSEVVDNTFTVSLTASGLAKAGAVEPTKDANGDEKYDYKDLEIRVYFDAMINTKAIVGTEIPNEVTLKYHNSVGIEFTDKEDAEVYTCGVHIYKYDAKDITKPLTGAEFKLAEVVAEGTEGAVSLVIKNAEGKPESVSVVYKEFYDTEIILADDPDTVDVDETTKKVSGIITDEYGNAVIYGLEEGTYYLVETKAPAGYNLLSYPVKVTLNQGSYINVDFPGTEANEDMTVRVANSNTFQLPATGGIGTTIFTLVGSLMMGSAGVILVNKKKED